MKMSFSNGIECQISPFHPLIHRGTEGSVPSFLTHKGSDSFLQHPQIHSQWLQGENRTIILDFAQFNKLIKPFAYILFLEFKLGNNSCFNT